MDLSSIHQNDLMPHALGMTPDKTSIEFHIGWIQQDIQKVFQEIEVLNEALAVTTDALAIERLTVDLLDSTQLIAELQDVIIHYGDIPSPTRGQPGHLTQITGSSPADS